MKNLNSPILKLNQFLTCSNQINIYSPVGSFSLLRTCTQAILSTCNTRQDICKSLASCKPLRIARNSARKATQLPKFALKALMKAPLQSRIIPPPPAALEFPFAAITKINKCSVIIDFAEFRRRVGNKCSVTDSRAFYEFKDRRGKPGEPLYVLLCCWLAAVGAGLLKSEEIFEGVARLSLSNDIEFEEQTFIAKMADARERRAKLNAAAPTIPMELRVEKALDAIYVCCFDQDLMEEEDVRLLIIMLSAVFPTVQQQEIQRLVKDKAKNVAGAIEKGEFPSEAKSLSKEAIKFQMKDLQFLKQNNENS